MGKETTATNGQVRVKVRVKIFSLSKISLMTDRNSNSNLMTRQGNLFLGSSQLSVECLTICYHRYFFRNKTITITQKRKTLKMLYLKGGRGRRGRRVSVKDTESLTRLSNGNAVRKSLIKASTRNHDERKTVENEKVLDGCMLGE